MAQLIYTLTYAVILFLLAWEAHTQLLIIAGYLASAWMFFMAILIGWRLAREND